MNDIKNDGPSIGGVIHPRVNFSRLDGREEILFAHKGGFIAKTRERLGEKDLIELAKMAIG